ncbi:F-box/LRR-repeat protein At3g26922-like [Chenopodium quinoa]|uniref:F-box/LRR-repeat protein At3g26922-like n=1 Tax=Chenopodium quinoa TaxID=63459 RepID=UPI000B76F059|nr:F-box/LRR-repeat protein At3g26922-like [Chenopodium quinoa]
MDDLTSARAIIAGAINCNTSPNAYYEGRSDRISRNLKDCLDKVITSKDLYNNLIPKRRRNNDNEVNFLLINDNSNVDRIGDLPDDVLLHLLSFVDMKSAGRTSLVSKRWRYVWTYLLDLDFEHPDFHLIHRPKTVCRPSYNYQLNRYCKWVNQVMTGNRASYLTTFRIHFPLYGSYTTNIDKWIAMALSKNVSNLELNLSTQNGHPIMLKNSYVIRQDFLSNNNALKTIHLEALVVEGDVVEYVLSNCLNLDRLTVKNCEFYLCGSVGIFPKTQVVVSSYKLKHFELSGCNNIKSIQISAPNLTCFKFLGIKQEVQYHSVSALVNVTFEDRYWYHNRKLNVFSKFSTQLEQLSLSWSLEVSWSLNYFNYNYVSISITYVLINVS